MTRIRRTRTRLAAAGAALLLTTGVASVVAAATLDDPAAANTGWPVESVRHDPTNVPRGYGCHPDGPGCAPAGAVDATMFP